MRLQSKEAREHRWQTAVNLHELGHSQQQISSTLGLCQSSISRVLSKHSRGEPLEEKVNKGAPPKLTQEQCGLLSEIVLAGAIQRGFESDFWTNKRIILVIQEEFNVSLVLVG